MGYNEDMEDMYALQEELRQAQGEQLNQEAQEEAMRAAQEEASREAQEGARQAAEESSRQFAEEAARQAADEEARQAAEEAARQAEEEARQAAEEARKAAEKAAEEARRAAAEEANGYMQEYEPLLDYLHGSLKSLEDNINLAQQWFNTYHQKLSSYPDSASGKFEWSYNDACGRLEYDEKQMMNKFKEAADNYQTKTDEINGKYNYWCNEYNKNNY